jgi:mRNA-degrading endonuclease RelE of RelBE toxin-antitoxin system
MTEHCPEQVEFTPEFKRNLRSLAKKYPGIRSDIAPVIEQISKGGLIGDQIPKTGTYSIFKVRVKNSDSHKGKSGGYRLIYYIADANKIVFITIYSKTEQGDVSQALLWKILKNYQNENYC